MNKTEIAPCPFCGDPCEVIGIGPWWVYCDHCGYESGVTKGLGTKADAIAAHNRIATAIPAEREPEGRGPVGCVLGGRDPEGREFGGREFGGREPNGSEPGRREPTGRVPGGR